MVGLGLESAGTEFAASADARNAFTTLIDGDSWMIFRNAFTGVLHWDFVSEYLGKSHFSDIYASSLSLDVSLASPSPTSSE